MKIFLLLTGLLLSFSLKNYVQTKSDEPIDANDSLEIMKDLMNILKDSEKTSSYFSFDLGIGNRIFNVRNNALNAKLTPVNTIIFSPSILYHHKTGLYFSAGGNLLNDNKKGFGFSQYSIFPGYELPENENIEFAFAYTHYFVEDNFSPYASPIQNDFYTFFAYKKTWIRPGLAVDYSNGAYGDVKRILRLYDSTTNKLKSISLIPSISHEFKWGEVFNKNDGINFNPALMMNIGQSKIAIQHKTNVTNLTTFLTKRGRLPKFNKTKFEPESAGLNLDASYVTGNFTVEPQAYFDCYLPSTEDKKLSSYFTLTMRYSLQ